LRRETSGDEGPGALLLVSEDSMQPLLPGAGWPLRPARVGAALAVLALACVGLLVTLGTKDEKQERLLQGLRT